MIYDENKANRVIKFIENLNHADGDWYGKSFKLLNWQREIINNGYGYKKDDDYRQYQYVYLEVPKKNGKSELAAALSLYHLFADGEIKGEIYGCAAEKKQAGIVFDVAVSMIEQCPTLKKNCKLVLSKKTIYCNRNQSKYEVLSAEAYSKHGYKPSAVIFDELHAQPNRNLWDIMTFGAGVARKQPMWFVITTAGDDPDKKTIGWEIHEKAKKIISGELVNSRWYCKIYGAEPEADIWDENVWLNSNPSLNNPEESPVISLENVRFEAEEAKSNPAQEKLFRWLRLNQWIDNKSTSWIDLTIYDKCVQRIDLTLLAGKKCYAGLDLSSTTDLTALTLVFPVQEGLKKIHTLHFCWIPEESMKERVMRDKVPYQEWVNQKYLTATPGNAIDYEYIYYKILNLSKLYDILVVGIDPWNSDMLTQKLQNETDIIVEIVNQTIAIMSPAMKKLEKIIRDKKIIIEKHPVARWCFGNVSIYVDGNENIKPMKNRSIDRIDLTVSMIDAIAIYLQHEDDESIYESRGLTVL